MLKPRCTQDYSGFYRKGGEEMESKGNFYSFIQDGTKDVKLRKAMVSVVKRKNITPEALLKEFRKRHYDGVTITDCRKVLKILENPMELQRLEEWHY